MSAVSVNKNNQKRVTISSKRQFTIPQKFFTELGFDREADCIMGEGMLILRPVSSSSSGDFAEQILSELINEGYSGKELLKEFKLRQAKIRPAVKAMIEAAKDAVNGIGEYYSYNDIFDSED